MVFVGRVVKRAGDAFGTFTGFTHSMIMMISARAFVIRLIAVDMDRRKYAGGYKGIHVPVHGREVGVGECGVQLSNGPRTLVLEQMKKLVPLLRLPKAFFV